VADEEKVEQTHTTDVESENEQSIDPEKVGLTVAELNEQRKGEGEEPMPPPEAPK
jgi:hypothetical protein